jgi:LacI family transcriptional regulator, galactose operon repressor
MDDTLKSQLPKALRIKEELKKAISDGKFGREGSSFISVRAIGDTYSVSIKTAQRIMTLLKNEGCVVLDGNKYVLTGLAHGVNGRGEKDDPLLGLIVTNLENPFFAILAKEMELAADRAGFKLLIASSQYDLDREREIVDMFRRAGVRGIIACPVHDNSLAELYSKLKIPYILIGRRPKGWKSDAVLVHNVNAGRMVADHFVDRHYCHFGYFGVDQFHPNPRFDGYIASLADHGYRVCKENIVKADPIHFERATDELKLMLSSAAKPIAVFCFHDLLAVHLVHVCQEMKLRIPDEVAICGFDNLPITGAMFPSLTTVAYPISDMANIAVDRVKRKISGEKNTKPFTCFLETDLIVRESSANVTEARSQAFAAYEYAYQLI